MYVHVGVCHNERAVYSEANQDENRFGNWSVNMLFGKQISAVPYVLLSARSVFMLCSDETVLTWREHILIDSDTIVAHSI